jgi:hypothetical protein
MCVQACGLLISSVSVDHATHTYLFVIHIIERYTHCANTAITVVVGECNSQFCNESDVTVLVLSMSAVTLA